VKNSILNFLLLFICLPLLSCQKSEDKIQKTDINSYINDFELLQENLSNDKTIRITSPKAIINTLNNDIEIFDSSIEIFNENSIDIIVTSRNSKLTNSTNFIKVFDNVNILLLDTNNYFIKTDSFIWDLNTSNIDLNSPLYFNSDATTIFSSKGIYNIKSGLLNIKNNNFNRIIFNEDGTEKYQIEIISDIANWFKNDNSLEFKSMNKQVEATINFLDIK
tara:strand:+ start:3381 stop:4040 length:660 start_codon:yes stop_codon:yes gene_type:complete